MWRSEDEMLAVVERRAAATRARRRMLTAGSGAAVVLVMAVRWPSCGIPTAGHRSSCGWPPRPV